MLVLWEGWCVGEAPRHWQRWCPDATLAACVEACGAEAAAGIGAGEPALLLLTRRFHLHAVKALMTSTIFQMDNENL